MCRTARFISVACIAGAGYEDTDYAETMFVRSWPELTATFLASIGLTGPQWLNKDVAERAEGAGERFAAPHCSGPLNRLGVDV